jgi:hypothetical protein
MLPTYFTWQRLLSEMVKAATAEGETGVYVPSVVGFRRVLQRECPNIVIKDPRSNVCDACVIYRNQLKSDPSSDVTELLGRHAEEARSMRYV